jgi:uncharacterized protein YbaP (TraB family)
MICLLLLGSAETLAAPTPTLSPDPTSSGPAAFAPDASDASLGEIDVYGVQPGPGLWKITRGDHVLWLLGTLDHVPRGMTWRSHEVETALSHSQELLESNPDVAAPLNPVLLFRLYVQWRGLQKDPEHTRLRDWLPAPLYARFEALKQRYDPNDGRIEELRPPFAALRLYRRAVDAAGLTRGNVVEHAVLEMAHREHVPLTRAQLHVADPLGTLKQVRALSPATQVDCLAATVTRLEKDLPVMQQRARAWAVGNVTQLRALPYPNQLEACETALSAAPDVRALLRAASDGWMSAAEAALDRHPVSFAMRPIYELLAADGPLAHFRAEGYRVKEPR